MKKKHHSSVSQACRSAIAAATGQMSAAGKTAITDKPSASAATPRPPRLHAAALPSANGKASPFATALGRKLPERGLVVCREVEANFRAWFERNFVDRRAGRIGNVSYSRAGALDDHPGDGVWYADAHARAWADYNDPLTASEMAYVFSHPLVAFQLSVGITDLRGLRCMRRGLTLCTNRLQQKSYRSRYYGRDNARRRMLAAERRKMTRRATTNPCPTPAEFRAAFARVRDSVEAKLRFGGMVHDLACYVDSCLRYDGAGNIVGRNGGIKEWLADNVPELYPRYKTIMRYKALAMRLRQAVGLKDPEPTSALLADSADMQYGEATSKGDRPCEPRGGGETPSNGCRRSEPPRVAGRSGADGGNENYYALKSHDGVGDRRGRDRGTTRSRREMAHRLLYGCANTFKDVFGRVDAALSACGRVDAAPETAAPA